MTVHQKRQDQDYIPSLAAAVEGRRNLMHFKGI